MLIEEEEPKGGDLNPDALEAVFEEEDVFIEVEEEDDFSASKDEEDEEADEIDIAFAANDEGYW